MVLAGTQDPATTLTVRELLQRGCELLLRHGIAGASLDMSLLLAEAMRLTRLKVYANLEQTLDADQFQRLEEMVRRRANCEPMAYILGHREFYGFDFAVTPDVLIPRPETELIVDLFLTWIEEVEPEEDPIIVDVGVGSGAIAVSGAASCLDGQWIATDISEAALNVARHNARVHGVLDRIDFRQGSMLDPVLEKVDVICCNPPYIAETDAETLPDDVFDYEPHQALFGGADGLECIRALIASAVLKLKPSGRLLIECGMGQSETVVDLLERAKCFKKIMVHMDLAGIARVIQADCI